MATPTVLLVLFDVRQVRLTVPRSSPRTSRTPRRSAGFLAQQIGLIWTPELTIVKSRRPLRTAALQNRVDR